MLLYHSALYQTVCCSTTVSSSKNSNTSHTYIHSIQAISCVTALFPKRKNNENTSLPLSVDDHLFSIVYQITTISKRKDKLWILLTKRFIKKISWCHFNITCMAVIPKMGQFKCPSDNSGKMKFLFFSTQCMSWCSFKKTMTC